MSLPKSKAAEKEHRRQKRQWEISLVIETLAGIVQQFPELKDRRLNILEFGSGDGFQIPFLQKLGNTVASDIYTSEDIRQLKDVPFYETSITRTPFRDGQFDLIFSNHVMEHIEDLPAAFAELKRIGSRGCIYAFSVPTNYWLLLGVPAQYYNKVRVLHAKVRTALVRAKSIQATGEATNDAVHGKSHAQKRRVLSKAVAWLLPNGHGVKTGFLDCHRAFKVQTWQQLFRSNGFAVLETKPLLLYGCSEWPLVRTASPSERSNFFSSVLFVLQRS